MLVNAPEGNDMATSLTLNVNGAKQDGNCTRYRHAVVAVVARFCRVDRHEIWLRHRNLRRLHGFGRWRPFDFSPPLIFAVFCFRTKEEAVATVTRRAAAIARDMLLAAAAKQAPALPGRWYLAAS